MFAQLCKILVLTPECITLCHYHVLIEFRWIFHRWFASHSRQSEICVYASYKTQNTGPGLRCESQLNVYNPNSIGSGEHSIFPTLQNERVYQTSVPTVITESAILGRPSEIGTGFTVPTVWSPTQPLLYVVQKELDQRGLLHSALSETKFDVKQYAERWLINFSLRCIVFILRNLIIE